MGCSYSARALVGVCLSTSELFGEKRVKAFEHDRSESMKFCPDTGRKLWETVDRCVLLPEDAEDEEDFSTVEPKDWLGGLYLFDDGRDSPEARYLLGDLAVEDDKWDKAGDSNFAPISRFKQVDDVANRVGKILEPHGIAWRQRFGLWVVLYASG